MSDLMALRIASTAARDSVHSARPDAPVVPEDAAVTRTSAAASLVSGFARRWSAAQLRAIARMSYRLSNRLDPNRLTGHRTGSHRTAGSCAGSHRTA